MSELGTLGSLGMMGGAGDVSPLEEMSMRQNAMMAPDMQALAQQLMITDPELAMQMAAGNVDPSMLAQLQSGQVDPNLMALLVNAPNGSAPPAMVPEHMLAPQGDAMRNMLNAPGMDMTQRPLNPETIQRVANALGLNPGDSGEIAAGTDPLFDPQGTDDTSLLQLLGGPGYVV